MANFSIDTPKYFGASELQLLKELESQQIQSVYYHYWDNIANPNELIEILDIIELVFIDQSCFYFSASELCDAIEIKEVNFETRAFEVLNKFKGKIICRKKDMTSDKTWQRIVEYPIDEVILDSDLNGQIFSDRLILKMGPLKVLLQIDELGLSVRV